MKPCEYYIELLSAGLDGMLSDEQERELAEHLAACPACRELGPQLVAAHAAFTQMEELQAPEGFAEGVMARVRAEEKTKPKVVPFFRRPAVKSLSALAACAVLCVGLLRSGGMEKLADAAAPASAPASSMPAAEAPAASAPAMAEDLGLDRANQYYSMSVDSTAACETAPAEPEARSGDTAVQAPQKSTPLECVDKEPEQYAFGGQTVLRVTWSEGEQGACILGSANSLERLLARFPHDDLSDLADVHYGEDYFKTGRLLAVVVEAPSGSNTYELGALYRDRVTVLEHAPQVGTCDMALWLILAEVDTTFDDGDILSIHLE